MKTNLYYFSGTGNSLKIAKDLASELGNVHLINIAKVIDQKQQIKADVIGIVFPVYIWGLPLIVERFAQQLQVSGNTYLFSVTTYGGFPANTNIQLKKIFNKKGLHLSAAWGIKMPGNYIPMYGAVSLEKQQQMFDNARTEVLEIAKKIKNSEGGSIKKNGFLTNWLFSGLIYNFSAKHIPEMAKSFWVNDKCNGCTICQKICPVGNIKMVDNKPIWDNRCEQCLACLQWCPEEAIESGKKTLGRKRYQHPKITIRDLLLR